MDPAQPDPGRAVVPLTGAQEAVLVYDAGLDLEPHLVRLTAAAASMALEHSRLQAEVQAQLELVRASRARIVEAGDAERRRRERDLHDGAQQRLVTLTLALGMARSRVAGADPELETLIEAAGKEAKEALTELRELARGIHPAVLTETGLAGAVQALVERSPAVVTITEAPRERFPAMIEATAYFVVSEALANVAKHARACTAQVSIRRLRRPDAVLHPPAYSPGGRTDRGLGYIHPHPFSGDEPETSGCGPLWPPGRTLRHRVEQDDWNFARRGVLLIICEMGHAFLLRGPDRGTLVARGHPGPGSDGGRADLDGDVRASDHVAEPLRVARLPCGRSENGVTAAHLLVDERVEPFGTCLGPGVVQQQQGLPFEEPPDLPAVRTEFRDDLAVEVVAIRHGRPLSEVRDFSPRIL